MKVKTITCHDVYNAGSSLQAYALATYLKNLGHDVEIIDYKPDYLSHHYPLWGLNNMVYDKPVVRELYNLAKLPGRIKARNSRRKKEYDRFTEEFLPLTEHRYHSFEELKTNPPEADVYFAGSDQIWNTFFENGKDPSFYLEFINGNVIKASYAASFSAAKIEDGWRDKVFTWLLKLDYISVRESSGIQLLNEIGINTAEQVLDPVFLLDANHWETIKKDSYFTDRYILVYDFDENQAIKEYAIQYAKKHNLKIYTIFKNRYGDKDFYDDGPEGFLSLILHADFIVSNSFHATAFSIIFEKPFAVFDRKERINARIHNLIELFGLKQINENTDYAVIRVKVAQEIKKSKQYIDRVLRKEKC